MKFPTETRGCLFFFLNTISSVLDSILCTMEKLKCKYYNIWIIYSD